MSKAISTKLPPLMLFISRRISHFLMATSAALTAALAFLAVNGVAKKFDPNSLYTAMIAIAEKRMTRAQLAELFRG